MRLITPVLNVMTRKPITVEPSTSLAEIHKIFEKQHFHHLPVVKMGKVVGVVSYTDYLRVVRNVFDNKHENKKNDQLMASMLAKDVMTKSVKTILPTNTVGDTLRLFKDNSYHSILIVDEKRKLKGILTSHDLILRLERKLLAEEAAIGLETSSM